MPEETETTETTTDTTTETTTVAPMPWADHEGNLKENWYNAEDLKDDAETFKRFKDIGSLAKSYAQVRKMVGADVVKKPDEKSTEEEWSAYFDAGGRPATALDYGFTKPDELPPEHYSEKVAVEAMELFHKLGLNKNQAKAVFDFHNNLVIENLKAQKHNDELEVQQAKDELIGELGAAYQTREHLGNVAIEVGCRGATPNEEKDSELKDIIIDEYHANPWFTRLMMNLGKHFAEHESVLVSSVPAPADIQSKIDEIRKKPEFMSPVKKIRQPLIDEVNRLTQQLLKSKGTTG